MPPTSQVSRETVTTTARDYARILETFARSAQPHLFAAGSGLMCFGPGGADNWASQTNLKASSALAVLASDRDYAPERAGVSRDQLLHQAIATLRFALETHHSGSARCTDGKQWGHSWISVLGLERSFHAFEALDPDLRDVDREAIRRVVSSEADWLLTSYQVTAGVVQDNHPESNLWNGSLLHRAAILSPDHENAGAWRDEGTRFLLNGISVASDAEDQRIIDGHSIADWHVGANFFPSYALNHHHYLNVGYMVICLSQVAMLHFWCKAKGIAPPAALDHHARDLWKLVRNLTFPDGRLARIGGDTRIRYCYCQDYAIPAWLWALDALDDRSTVALERGWLAQVRREVATNADGSFLGTRLAELAGSSRLYYTRLESDRANSLSMGLWWRRRHDLPTTGAAAVESTWSWSDEHHGAAAVRGSRRLASWCWQAADPPMALCVPLDRSDLAEWRENLALRVRGEGRHHVAKQERKTVRDFTGGFVAAGRMDFASGRHVAEGIGEAPIGRFDLAVAALPDDATLVILERYRTPSTRTWLTRFQALNWLVPNDLWNGNRRVYAWEGGGQEALGTGSEEDQCATGSPWLTVDGHLSVAVLGEGTLSLYRPGRRQVGLVKRGGGQEAWDGWGGSLYCDEIGVGRRAGLHEVPRDTDLADLAYAVRIDCPAAEARTMATSGQHLVLEGDGRAAWITGKDHVVYLLAAAFGDGPVTMTVDQRLQRLDVDTAVAEIGRIEIAAGNAALYRVI